MTPPASSARRRETETPEAEPVFPGSPSDSPSFLHSPPGEKDWTISGETGTETKLGTVGGRTETHGHRDC